MEARTIRLLTYFGVVLVLFMKPTSCTQDTIPRPQHEMHNTQPTIAAEKELPVASSVNTTSKKDEICCKILSEAVIDDPRLTLAISNLLFSGPISKSMISKVLHEQYYSLIERRGLKESTFPAQIEIYAFDSAGLAEGVWVGMLEKKPHLRVPVIHVNHEHFSFLQTNKRHQAAIQEFAKDAWHRVAKIHYHHSTHTAEIIVEFGDLPWNDEIAEMCNSDGGVLIEVLFKKFSYLDNIIIKAFGDGLDIYGQQRKIQLYYVKADRPTVQKINFNTLGHEVAVKTIFKPWHHPQIKS